MKKEELILHCVTKLLPCLLYTGSWQRRSVRIGSDDFRLNYLLHDGLGKTLKLARNTAAVHPCLGAVLLLSFQKSVKVVMPNLPRRGKKELKINRESRLVLQENQRLFTCSRRVVTKRLASLTVASAHSAASWACRFQNFLWLPRPPKI